MFLISSATIKINAIPKIYQQTLSVIEYYPKKYCFVFYLCSNSRLNFYKYNFLSLEREWLSYLSASVSVTLISFNIEKLADE